jgi:SpoIID/LytB domain protein
VCTHPDLKRPLTPSEALAYSCNDFFLALAPRLSRQALNRTRSALGLPPVLDATPLAPTLVGLAGPRVTPRDLLSVMARLAGAGREPFQMRPETRRVLLDGLRGAAEYGTADAFKARGLAALAKTGTAPMPGGGSMGLVVALTPPDAPARGLVVVTPGAAGLDAATVAADLLAAPRSTSATQTPTPRTGAPAPGRIRLGRTMANGTTRVEALALEDYVAEVLAGEGEPGAAQAAQQALAIVARTYALANRNRHGDEGFDMCDTTHCQVVRSATTATRGSATATAGRVLLHEGRPAQVFHSAWCGGHPERASNVWPGLTDLGRAVPAEDTECAGEPGWQSLVRVADLERALRTGGLRGDRLRGLQVIQRSASGRAARVRLEGFAPGDMSGEEFRTLVGRVLGWQVLKSTLFEVTRTGEGYRFNGRGFGHGVGLCVLGAGRRAASGATVEHILAFYFPGLTIGPVGQDEVALALPAEEESERQMVLSMVRRSRDEVAKAASVGPPPQIRVTVHPTVESFTRATGQPWFAAGATSGTTIHLLPIAILEKQGQLDRVIRHEVAHVLLDSSLSDRPLWVREGAARYFAGQAAATKASSPVSCPTDQELRRAADAAAQRRAYERAEACFAHAIRRGTAWRDVR